MLTPTSTLPPIAIAGAGAIIINVISIFPKSNLFILQSPLANQNLASSITGVVVMLAFLF